MKPPGHGTRRDDDCLRLAVSCLLEIPYRETCATRPGTPDFYPDWRRWAKGRGLSMHIHNGPLGPNGSRGHPAFLDDTVGPWREWIAVVRGLSGEGRRAGWPLHAVVMERDRIFFDPARPAKRRRRIGPRSVIYALTFSPLHTGVDAPTGTSLKGGSRSRLRPPPPNPLDSTATIHP